MITISDLPPSQMAPYIIIVKSGWPWFVILTIFLSYRSLEKRQTQPVGFEVSLATEHSSENMPYGVLAKCGVN
jgi:uncharacterized membrane protein